MIAASPISIGLSFQPPSPPPPAFNWHSLPRREKERRGALLSLSLVARGEGGRESGDLSPVLKKLVERKGLPLFVCCCCNTWKIPPPPPSLSLASQQWTAERRINNTRGGGLVAAARSRVRGPRKSAALPPRVRED